MVGEQYRLLDVFELAVAEQHLGSYSFSPILNAAKHEDNGEVFAYPGGDPRGGRCRCDEQKPLSAVKYGDWRAAHFGRHEQFLTNLGQMRRIGRVGFGVHHKDVHRIG